MDAREFLEEVEPEDCHDNIKGTVEPEQLVNSINIDNKALNIIHVNIRGISTNFDNLLVFIQTFSLWYCDVIILTECHRIVSGVSYSIPGYSMYYNGADYNLFDGIVIYSKQQLNSLISTCKLVHCGISITRVEFKIDDVTYGINAIYRSPSSNLNEFLNEIDTHIQVISSQDIELIVGDMNINILNSDDISVNKYLSMLAAHGFLPMFKEVTRTDSGTCLDHIFLRKKAKIIPFVFTSFVINFDLTDHFPVMFNAERKNQIINHQNETKNNSIKRINFERLNRLADEVDWDNTLNIEGTQNATEYLVNKIIELIKRSEMPVIYRNHRRKIKPWISNALVVSIKKRDKMKKNLRNNPSNENLEEYKKYRNQLNKLIKITKNNYYKEKINENPTDMRKIYKLAAEATNEPKKNNNSQPQILHPVEGHVLSDGKEVADCFNVYFSDIGQKMANKIKQPLRTIQSAPTSNCSLFLRPVTPKELIKHINKLKNNCSPGMDGITTKVLKGLHVHILNPLCYIINLIFKTGIVPEQFKVSIVTPIYKNAGNILDLGNYRPISVISNLSKIFERCLKERVINFVAKNNILSKSQFGFMESRSTTDAIYELIREVVDNMNRGRKNIAVFLDLAKAFDTVSHPILLETLERYGMRGIVLDVFKSYLMGRTQYVKVGKSLSEPKQIKMGVPQGTVLGPILFNLYINTLYSLDMEGRFFAYADDTVLLVSGSTWEDVKQLTIMGMEKTKCFLDNFKLTLNISKTTYIAFTALSVNRPDFNEIKIPSLEEPIKEVFHIKYLGIMVDFRLKWDVHIQYLCKKLRFFIHKFYLLREFLNRRLLIMFYRTLVEPLFRYGLLVWGGAYNIHLEPLKIIQNYIVRVMLQKPARYSSSLLYCDDICDIKRLFIISNCNFIYKNIIKVDMIYHKYRTRSISEQHLNIPRGKTNVYQRSVSCMVPRIYNLIPKNIRTITNFKKFKMSCKKFILDNIALFSFI